MKVDKNILVYSNYIHVPFNIHKHYCSGNRILGVAQNYGKMQGVAWIDASLLVVFQVNLIAYIHCCKNYIYLLLLYYRI